MAVNTQARTIAEHSVNGIDDLIQMRERSNEAINGKAIADNSKNTRTEFPLAAGFFRRFSKTNVLKFLKLISEISEQNFNNRNCFLGNISESFQKIFSRNSAPAKEISEIEEYEILVVIVRKSA